MLVTLLPETPLAARGCRSRLPPRRPVHRGTRTSSAVTDAVGLAPSLLPRPGAVAITVTTTSALDRVSGVVCGDACVPGFGCGLARESVGGWVGLVLRLVCEVLVSVSCVSRLPPVSFYRLPPVSFYFSCVSRLPPVSFYRLPPVSFYSHGT